MDWEKAWRASRLVGICIIYVSIVFGTVAASLVVGMTTYAVVSQTGGHPLASVSGLCAAMSVFLACHHGLRGFLRNFLLM